jgi:hypothetical protein
MLTCLQRAVSCPRRCSTLVTAFNGWPPSAGGMCIQDRQWPWGHETMTASESTRSTTAHAPTQHTNAAQEAQLALLPLCPATCSQLPIICGSAHWQACVTSAKHMWSRRAATPGQNEIVQCRSELRYPKVHASQ